MESPEILTVSAVNAIKNPQEKAVAPLATINEILIESREYKAPIVASLPVVSAFSLASIKAKRELQETNKSIVKEAVALPSEPFNETDVLLHWNKYAQKLGDKGYKIMESLLLINDPVVKQTAISIELPNEGSKIDFEKELSGLLGYLKGHLHNHDITISVLVNEAVENKFAYSVQDKFNRLNEINPNLELLKKTFDLDL